MHRPARVECSIFQTIVLPPVIREGDFFPFKFWFNNSIQDGMYYRNELFYRLYSVSLKHRAKLYHHACRMAQDEMVVVSAGDRICSLWISLRGSGASELQGHNLKKLPPFLELTDGE